jgi:hypothetical protein
LSEHSGGDVFSDSRRTKCRLGIVKRTTRQYDRGPRENNEGNADMRKFLRIFLLGSLAACASNAPPPDDHTMSDPLLVMKSARLGKSLGDVKAESTARAVQVGNGDLGVAMSAANTGLSAALPAAGMTSLAGGLLGGLSLLTAAHDRTVPGQLTWLLVWAPDDGTDPEAVAQHYATIVGTALTRTLSERLPGVRFHVSVHPDSGDFNHPYDYASVDFDHPVCGTLRIHCKIRFAINPLGTAPGLQLPTRLVGYGQQQIPVAVVILMEIDGHEDTLLTHRRWVIWPTLEAFVDASRDLPPYVWIYIGPEQVGFGGAGPTRYVRQPIMLHQGSILRFVKPAAPIAQAGTATP